MMAVKSGVQFVGFFQLGGLPLDLVQSLLVKSPCDDASQRRAEDKKCMDARPRPRCIDSSLVIENFFGRKRAQQPMMQRNIDDGEYVRNPVLQQRQERKHNEEMKMEFDITARQVHEYGR